MKNQVLFIDDEPNLLAGLRRSLRPFKDEWEMEFALGGEEALRQVEERSFDVVVCDMKMPEMDGAEVLRKVKEIRPCSVRIVLSGQAEEEAILRALKYSHQYVSKPCEGELLQARLRKACGARDLLRSEELKRLTTGLDSLITLPENLECLQKLQEKSRVTLEEVQSIIERDIGMSAKLLQLTSSDYFGIGERHSDISQAVRSFGVERIFTLLERADVFRPIHIDSTTLNLKKLSLHAYRVANTARRIAKLEGASEETQAEAYTAGLLHEIGRVVLVHEMSEEYAEVLLLVQEKGLTHHQAEKEVFSSNHSEVGAYLVALWGLSESIVEAIAYQDDPMQAEPSDFRLLSIVHAANALEDELLPTGLDETKVELRMDYIEAIEKVDRVEAWRDSLDQLQSP